MHVDVQFNGFIAEVQITHRTRWVYKEWAHESYKAGYAGEGAKIFDLSDKAVERKVARKSGRDPLAIARDRRNARKTARMVAGGVGASLLAKVLSDRGLV